MVPLGHVQHRRSEKKCGQRSKLDLGEFRASAYRGIIKVQSVGSNGTTLFCGTESGIYRSTNHGASWSIANGTLTANWSTYVNKIYNFNGVLFVVFSGMSSNSNGGVFRTVDNGTTWLSAYNGLSTNMTNTTTST